MPHVADRFPNLSFERPEYQDNFETKVNRLRPDVRDILLQILAACVGSGGPYVGMVALGVAPFAVRLFAPGSQERHFAWLCPKRDHVNVRLFKGSQVGDMLNLVTNPDLTGMPPPVNLKVAQRKEIATALAYLGDAAARYSQG